MKTTTPEATSDPASTDTVCIEVDHRGTTYNFVMTPEEFLQRMNIERQGDTITIRLDLLPHKNQEASQ